MRKCFYTGIVCALMVGMFKLENVCNANDSLYAVQHNNVLNAFVVVNDTLEFQRQIDIQAYGFGAIDITMDDSAKVLFITYEYDSGSPAGYKGGNIIELYNATTLDHIKLLTVGPVGINLTGLAYDSARSKLYATNRNTDELYVFDWNPNTLTLTADPCSPIELDNMTYACGLALDGDTLYVSDYFYSWTSPITSDIVYAYDLTDNYSYIASYDMESPTVALAYNPQDEHLYSGEWLTTTSITKRPLDANSVITKDIDTNVIAMIADPDTTGRIYITTYRDDPCSIYNGSVEIYDTSAWISDPNQTITYTDIYNSTNEDGITISNLAGLAIGGPYKPEIMGVTVTPDPCTCVYPTGYGDPCYIEYTICYSGGEQGSQANTWLTAYLPWEVYPTDPCDENYDWENHVFMWSLSTVAGDANDCVSFEVYVTDLAEPLGPFDIRVELESDTSYTTETITTDVCCWGGDIIYVDEAADSLCLGTSWEFPYTNLKDALDRAGEGCGDEIWVAQGIYIPGTSSSDKFTVPTGVELYGGFAGNETSLSQRDPHHNLTILSGGGTCSTVVSITDANDGTIIDGFAITQSASQGIDCDNTEMNILNCVIADNLGDGINIDDGTPYISHCNIYDNVENGINTANAAPEIKNSLIHNNGETGIVLDSPSDMAAIHNNTICYNNIGISRSGGTTPDIRNCIIYSNATDQAAGATPEYSCIQDPNNAPSCTPNAYHNITADPCFAYDPNLAYNFHLSPNSCCVDKGDNTYVDDENGETDIDGDTRIIDGDGDYTDTVDMGADEVACTDVYHEMDITGDGIINGDEFYLLATAWLSDPCDNPADANTPNWNPNCDFYEDDFIDMIDLGMLADVWLWQACYYNNSYLPMMMRSGGGGDYLMASSSMESMMAFSSFSTASLLSAESISVDSSDYLTEAQRRRIWQQFRPPHTPSIGQRIIQLKEIIYWLKQIWYADDGIQEEIDEEEFWDFINSIQDELELLEEQYLQSLPVESE